MILVASRMPKTPAMIPMIVATTLTEPIAVYRQFYRFSTHWTTFKGTLT